MDMLHATLSLPTWEYLGLDRTSGVPDQWAHPVLPQWLANELHGRTSQRVPSTIWMYWDSGLAHLPDIVAHCITSWVIMNPTWHVQLLTDETVLDYLPGWTTEKWVQVLGAHKGDIARITLLRDHGGVWADATQFCLLPLNHWILKAMGDSDFFAFAVGAAPSKDSVAFAGACPGCEPPGTPVPPRAGCLARGGIKVDARTQRTLSLSNSFLAATPHSYIAAREYDCFVGYMLKHLKAPEYT